MKVKSLSRVRLLATPWTVAHQAPPSMGFSRQECWSGLPFPSPGDLPHLGIKCASCTAPALAGWFFTSGPTRAHGSSRPRAEGPFHPGESHAVAFVRETRPSPSPGSLSCSFPRIRGPVSQGSHLQSITDFHFLTDE